MLLGLLWVSVCRYCCVMCDSQMIGPMVRGVTRSESDTERDLLLVHAYVMEGAVKPRAEAVGM